MTSVGINLAPIEYWSQENPFLDRFKTAGTWGATGTSAPVQLDANGNPVGLPAGATMIANMFAVDAAGSGTSSIYELSYTGTGSVNLGSGATIISSQPGKIVFQANVDNGMQYLYLTSDSTTDPVKNIHVVRQDQVALFNSGEIFNPDFVDKVSNFHTLRFMDWEQTNSSNVTTWNDRSHLSDATWSTNSGVPLEVMVKLANEAHTDMWFNVPTKADDTYVHNALQYIHDNLDPSLKVYVEYSNEVWNLGFWQSGYSQQMADNLWAVDANHNGTIDSSEQVWGGRLVYYGYRAAQIAAAAQSVFGSDASARLVDVLAGQSTNWGGSGSLELQGVARANLGSAGSLFSQYATTTYFGYQMGSGNPADQAKVLAWATSGSAGLDAAFHELEFGGALSSNASLNALLPLWTSDAANARAAGMSLVAYEGGADLEYASFPADQQATIRAFFQEMMNDPRMGDLYSKMVSTFTAAGGVEVNAYNDTSGPSAFGYWGVLDSIYQDGSPRYDALLAAAQGGTINHALAPLSLIGTAANDTLVGGDGNDSIMGSSSTTNANGAFIENDYYMGGAGADTIIGGQGNDHIYGNNMSALAGAADGGDSLFGGAGNDYIQGNAGNDTIDGGTGNDRLYGGADNDSLIGGTGSDYLQGNRGNDTLDGGADNDTLRGGADNDSLMGGSGNDVLYGDAGNDVLVGGTGHDTMTGGAGADTFSFSAGDSTFTLTGVGAFVGDEITDFTHGVDKIALGFSVSSLLETAPTNPLTTVAAAEAYAQQLLNAHTGSGEVAAVQVGGDTYLFFNGAGSDGASIDSVIKLDNVTPASVSISDFI